MPWQSDRPLNNKETMNTANRYHLAVPPNFCSVLPDIPVMEMLEELVVSEVCDPTVLPGTALETELCNEEDGGNGGGGDDDEDVDRYSG